MDLKGKVAIVTGGFGGIGRAIAARLMKEGARVAVVDVAVGPPSTLPESDGENLVIHSDITRPGLAEDIARRVHERFKTLDILVNAAGIQGPIGPFADTGMDDWVSTINVNLLGTVNCCSAVLPYMAEKKAGKIINFAGGGANFSRPNFSAYAVSKAAVVRFTEVLADELKTLNIQVNAVAPGVIKTQMISEILKAGTKKAGGEYEQMQSRMEKGFDSPEFVAELVCYLASESSNWLTGRNISAIWDPWREWMTKGPADLDKDMYVLRRIDGRNFIKATK